jgi:hypothetical protein
MRACFPSGRQMQDEPLFHRLYTSILVRGFDPHEFTAILWINRESPTIGILRGPGTITVPGYLLDGNPQTVAHLGAGGELVVTATPGRPAWTVLPGPPGPWHAEITTDRPNAVEPELVTAGDGLIGLRVRSAEAAEIREVRLLRDLSTR